MKLILKQLQKQHNFRSEVAKERQKESLGHGFTSKMKQFDLYGQPFNISFEGKKSYQTVFGGIISLLVILAILGYAGFRLASLIDFSDYSYYSYEQIISIDDTNYDLNHDNFPLVLSIIGNLTEDIGYIKFRQIYQEQVFDNSSGSYYWRANQRNIPVEICSDYVLSDYASNGGFTYCTSKNETYSIGGSINNQKLFNRIFIEVYQCVGQARTGGPCKTSTQIQEFFKQSEMLISMKNSYLMTNDFDEPIRYYYNTENVYLPYPNSTINSAIYIQMNQAQLYDSRVLGPAVYQTLIQQGRSKTLLSTLDAKSRVLNVQINLDSHQTIYIRKVYTFAQFLSDIGGIKTAIFAIGSIITIKINEDLKFGSLIKRVYQIKRPKNRRFNTQQSFPKSPRTSLAKKSNSQNSKDDDPELQEHDDFDEIQKGLYKYNKRETFKENIGMFSKIQQYFSKVIDKNKQKIDVADFIKGNKKYVYNYLINREQFDMKLKDAFRFLFKCYCIKDRCRKNKKSNKDEQKYFYLQKGTKKIYQEFDIVNMIKTMRQLKLITNIFMNEKQRTLFRYQRHHLLESNTSSSENEDEILENYQIQKLKDKNKAIRAYLHNIVKSSLNYFDEHNQALSKLDKRIIAGLIFKNITNDQILDMPVNGQNNTPLRSRLNSRKPSINVMNLDVRKMDTNDRLNIAVGKLEDYASHKVHDEDDGSEKKYTESKESERELVINEPHSEERSSMNPYSKRNQKNRFIQ